MTYHIWGDETVDWRGIDDAARYIGEFLKRWGRVNVTQYKEKWGTVRVYCSLGWHSLLNMTHPGWVCYTPYPNWLTRLDIFCLGRALRKLNFLVVPFHVWIYRRAYKRAIAKWPHLEAEIIDGADYHELLEDLRSSDGP